jgi:hypothetical protein
MQNVAGQLPVLCAQLEAILVRQLLDGAGVGKHDLSPDAAGADSQSTLSQSGTQSLFVAALADAIENAGGLGLGAALARMLAAGRPNAS